MPPRLHTLLLLAVFSLTGLSSGRAAESVAAWTDLITPLQSASPRMRFHQGGVDPATNQPLVLPALPDIPGPPSDWYVAQWQQSSYLGAAEARTLPGHAGWTFSTPDGHLGLRIGPIGDLSGNSYLLFENGGTLTAGGGSNLFLTSAVHPVTANYGAPVQLRVGVRIKDAFVRYDTPEAKASGAVLAMAFIGTGALFLPPAGDPELPQFVFVQVPLTISESIPAGPGIVCSLAGDQPMLLYSPDRPRLPFVADGRTRLQVVDMQRVIRDMVGQPYPCGGRTMMWSAAQRDLRNWQFTGLYAGLEVENRDARPGAPTAAPQGQAELGVEFTELSVRRRADP